MKTVTKKILASLLMLTLFCGFVPLTAYAQADITAAFTDPNFLAQVYRVTRKTAPEPIFDTDVANVKIFNVSGRNIQSLAGLEYFVSLTTLDCYNNQLTSLPALPPSLAKLDCSNNQLTALPALPSGLTSLLCSDNQLTGIDVTGLPLDFLRCFYNNMADITDIIGYERGILSFYPQNIVTPGSIEMLRDQLAAAKAVKRGLFTVGRHWRALQTAIAESQAFLDQVLLDDTNFTGKQVSDQCKLLKDAVEKVEKLTVLNYIAVFFYFIFFGWIFMMI